MSLSSSSIERYTTETTNTYKHVMMLVEEHVTELADLFRIHDALRDQGEGEQGRSRGGTFGLTSARRGVERDFTIGSSTVIP
jgi:hypothetical protein